MQHHHIHCFKPGKGLNGSPTRITGRCRDNGHLLAALCEHMGKELAEQLHGQVLEGQGRPVKQLKQELVCVQLRQRRDGRMGEGAIGSFYHAGDIVFWDRRGKGPDNARGHVRVRTPGHVGEIRGAEGWPGLGHVEAAITGKTREEHVFKVENRGVAAG